MALIVKANNYTFFQGLKRIAFNWNYEKKILQHNINF